jgi:molybdopterin synthase catalytic subunit
MAQLACKCGGEGHAKTLNPGEWYFRVVLPERIPSYYSTLQSVVWRQDCVCSSMLNASAAWIYSNSMSSTSISSQPPNGLVTGLKDVLDRSNFPQVRASADGLCTVSLTYDPLSSDIILRSIRSPNAGANVLFLGTTRDSFDGRAVSRLSYSAYPALAMKTFLGIAERALSEFGLEKVYIVHRLGVVEVEEESIAVAVSAGHRGPAWKGAEEILEGCKERVEIFKMEEFVGEKDGAGEWRANKNTNADGKAPFS